MTCPAPSSLRTASSASRMSSNSTNAVPPSHSAQLLVHPLRRSFMLLRKRQQQQPKTEHAPKPGGFRATQTLRSVPKRTNSSCNGAEASVKYANCSGTSLAYSAKEMQRSLRSAPRGPSQRSLCPGCRHRRGWGCLGLPSWGCLGLASRLAACTVPNAMHRCTRRCNKVLKKMKEDAVWHRCRTAFPSAIHTPHIQRLPALSLSTAEEAAPKRTT